MIKCKGLGWNQTVDDLEVTVRELHRRTTMALVGDLHAHDDETPSGQITSL
jgi:hypothetical protein